MGLIPPTPPTSRLETVDTVTPDTVTPDTVDTVTPDTVDSVPEPPDGPVSPPPAEVLDATVVFFDADDMGPHSNAEAPRLIEDEQALDAFEAQYVDGDPAFGSAPREALEAGQLLVGGMVSRGCYPAQDAQLAFDVDEVLLLPIGIPADDGNVECYRAITSVALLSIDPADLPDLPIGGL